jgi:Zn finger protein HypA/HybF involved in hydrogenase expression
MRIGEKMDELISREQAIDAIKSEKVEVFHELYDEAWNDALNGCIDVIEHLPSIQPKRGKWIIKDDTERFIAQCNCCRYIEDSRKIKNFCPNCGSRNEVTT